GSADGRKFHEKLGKESWKSATYRTVKCFQCGEEFQTRDRRKLNRRFCGYHCRNAHRLEKEHSAYLNRPKRIIPCDWCGSNFEAKRKNARFCTLECGVKFRNN